MKLKRFILLPFFLILLFVFASCGKNNNIIDFYSINDFHGRIVERGKEPGIAKMASFLKQREKENPNTVILNAGDHFQDTYDSGTNRGNLLAKSLPLMHTEAMAIGNHEFDWGIERLKENRGLAGATTFLGANIYHYDEENNRVLDFASELAEPYKVIERSGHKIGLIGVIGEDQITSITSTIMEGLIFLDPLDIVPDLADKLREEEGCEAVVLIAHAAYKQLGYDCVNKITSISPKTNKRYVDAVFNGHTHKDETYTKNGVAFMQAGAHGESISKISLDLSENKPKTLEYQIIKVNPNDIKPDKEVSKLVDLYLNDSFYEFKDKKLAKINGTTYLKRKYSGQMLAKITYEFLPDEHKDVAVVLNNGGRSDIKLKDGYITPGLIYDALPFTNKTYIAMIKGSDLKSLLLSDKSYYAYYAPLGIKLDSEAYYKVAAIDYVLFHKNVYRKYDRLPSFTGETLYVEERYSNTLCEEYFKLHQKIDFRDISTAKEYSNLS